MFKHYFALGIGLVSSLCSSNVFVPTAIAGETCNFLNKDLWMAQAALNDKQIWTSEGWWVIAPGSCVVYADTVSTYFKYGEAATPQRLDDESVTENTLCVVDDRFSVVQADDSEACSMANGRMVKFVNPGSTVELLKSNL